MCSPGMLGNSRVSWNFDGISWTCRLPLFLRKQAGWPRPAACWRTGINSAFLRWLSASKPGGRAPGELERHCATFRPASPGSVTLSAHGVKRWFGRPGSDRQPAVSWGGLRVSSFGARVSRPLLSRAGRAGVVLFRSSAGWALAGRRSPLWLDWLGVGRGDPPPGRPPARSVSPAPTPGVGAPCCHAQLPTCAQAWA